MFKPFVCRESLGEEGKLEEFGNQKRTPTLKSVTTVSKNATASAPFLEEDGKHEGSRVL